MNFRGKISKPDYTTAQTATDKALSRVLDKAVEDQGQGHAADKHYKLKLHQS